VTQIHAVTHLHNVVTQFQQRLHGSASNAVELGGEGVLEDATDSAAEGDRGVEGQAAVERLQRRRTGASYPA